MTLMWLKEGGQFSIIMIMNETVEPTRVINHLIDHEYDEARMKVSDIHTMTVNGDDDIIIDGDI